jgi:uncharacterized protein
MRRFCMLAALVLLGPVAANAASFDCAKARAADEKAICRHRALEDADVRMATMFELEGHLLAMGGRGALQDAQVAWLKQRRRCGGNVACLTRSYDRRLAELQRTFDAIAARGPF